MWFSSVRSWFKKTGKSTRVNRRDLQANRRPKRTFRPGLEALEDRAVPALMVTNLNDDGAGSLRQAIRDSNATPAVDDMIVFQPGLTGVIPLFTGHMEVVDTVSIVGPGSGLLTISANTLSRIFLFNNTDPDLSTFSLSGVTLTEGTVGGGLFGGAIFINSEDVTLNDVVVMHSTAASFGGGIYVNTDGRLTLENCTISDNRSVGSGGGLFLSDGTVTSIRNSTISGNRTFDAGSTGGGIFFGGGSLTIDNTTVSGNSSTNSGGGIRVAGLSAAIRNSTVAFNTTGGGGGGIWIDVGTLTLTSTIVADNAAGQSPDIAGTVAAQNCLVESTAGTVFDGGGNNVTNVDPRLGPLASNGGLTRTHALLVGSPARNAGFNFSGAAFDQRGPGFARVVGAAADIGAFEAPLPVVSILVKRVKLRTRVDVVVDGVLRRRFFPFGTFTGKVQVLKVDVNGDGLLDVIARATVGGKRRRRTLLTPGSTP